MSEGAGSQSGGSRFAEVSGAVLLGGESSRMGSDKARLELRGQPAAIQLARLLDGFCAEVLLVGGDAPACGPGRRIVDPPGPASPLRGLVGALRAATTPKVLVVATDYYGLRLDLLLALLAYPEADAVVPRDAGHLHPLCALYRREPALAAAEAALASSRLALHGVLETLELGVLEGEDLARFSDGGRALVNVNTPEELAAYRRGEQP